MLTKEGKSSRETLPGDSFDFGGSESGEGAATPGRTRVCLDLEGLAHNKPFKEDSDVCAKSVPERTHVCSELPTVSTWSLADEDAEEEDLAECLKIFASENGKDNVEAHDLPKSQPKTSTRSSCRLMDIVLRRRAEKPVQQPTPSPTCLSPDAPSLCTLVARPRSQTPSRAKESLSLGSSLAFFLLAVQAVSVAFLRIFSRAVRRPRKTDASQGRREEGAPADGLQLNEAGIMREDVEK